MIPTVRLHALLQWTVSGNQFLQLLQLPAVLSPWSLNAVRMPTVRDSGAPSFRRECSVRVRIVRIICTRASLPSLKNRRSARSSSSIGRNRSKHVSGTVVHAYGVSFGGSVLKSHTSAALHFVVRQALTRAIKIPRSL